MSSLHDDRLLEGGAAPADEAAPGPRPTRPTTPSSTGVVEEKATSTVPPQRQGKARSAEGRTAPGSTSRTTAGSPAPSRRSATAKAATAKAATAKAATAKAVTAATARAASAKAATATAATRKAAGAARTVVAARKAAARPTGAKPTAAKPTAAKPTAAKPTAAKPTAAKPTAAKPTAAKPTAAKPTAAKPTAAKPTAAKPTAAKPTAAKPTAAKPTAAKPTAAKPTAAKPTPAQRTAAKPAGSPQAGRRHRATAPAPAAVTAARAAVVKAIAAKVAADARAVRRPTPYKRSRVDLAVLAPVVDVAALVEPQPAPGSALVVVKDAPAPLSLAPVFIEPVVTGRDVDADCPDAAPARVIEAAARGRLGAFLRRPPMLRRRPALYLAAALVGALSIGGAATAAPLQVDTRTVSQSVSVAEQLGIAGEPVPVVDEDVTSRLGELVASRNERDAERVAAADAQAEADRIATEEAARAAAEAARPKAVNPVEGGRLTSGFGARWGTMHAGIDLAAPMRTPERAAMDGVVLEAGAASGFGLAVYIQHDNGDVTVYGHMDEILVEPGQIVRAGDTIALLGNRGQSTGPHLHFEVHVGGLDGAKVDPVPWLRERGVEL
ncbi:peptidoglycan DD-metalloendopeptidase family protein [Blastococcus xanthinilyticus]|uniref:Murein DD-endopeptidase MepM/ murein hydrolase activator NlpD n=1 Tax=Blastococcus xanthinilyticus TaxID=1564164 RepID=A0A5S5CQC6_9ACTN|nr:peptidoglycan DD-metalloendopeptidase family protein [Blastococcus xanthinilyticus]TYP82817.1 murein DD-endopeptidase MepM/ murein hydrolase activator NlpD [Blastococcus xanthinilyticus]